MLTKSVDKGRFERVVERAREAGLVVEELSRSGGEKFYVVHLSRYQELPRIAISDLNIEVLEEYDFANCEPLGPYRALWDRLGNTLEFEVRSLVNSEAFDTLPGYSRFELSDQPTLFSGDSEEDGLDAGPLVDMSTPIRGRRISWTLPVHGTRGHDILISPISRRLATFEPRTMRLRRPENFPSIKIAPVNFDSVEDAIEGLRGFSNSLFFELDYKYGVKLSVPRINQRVVRVQNSAASSDRSLELPRRRYELDPVTIYMYATGARMPLQEYLGYYQTLEYYFDSYWRRELLSRLRIELVDPAFSPEDNNRLARLVGLVNTGGKKGGRNERNQLESVLVACVETEDLTAFIEASGDRKAALCERKRALAGVQQLSLSDKNRSIHSQISERVYAIRCRIVHGKDEGGGEFAPPLFPLSEESLRLQHDVDLVRFLAQRVLIASSKPDPWWA